MCWVWLYNKTQTHSDVTQWAVNAFSTLFRRISTPNNKPLKYQRRFERQNFDAFRRASKYSYVFKRFFDVEMSTLIRRRIDVPLGNR